MSESHFTVNYSIPGPTKPVLAHALMTSSSWIYLALIVGGFLLYLLGNLVFGAKQEGGKRLLIYLAGAAISILATLGFIEFYPQLVEHDYPRALIAPGGCRFLVFRDLPPRRVRFRIQPVRELHFRSNSQRVMSRIDPLQESRR